MPRGAETRVGVQQGAIFVLRPSALAERRVQRVKPAFAAVLSRAGKHKNHTPPMLRTVIMHPPPPEHGPWAACARWHVQIWTYLGSAAGDTTGDVLPATLRTPSIPVVGDPSPEGMVLGLSPAAADPAGGDRRGSSGSSSSSSAVPTRGCGGGGDIGGVCAHRYGVDSDAAATTTTTTTTATTRMTMKGLRAREGPRHRPAGGGERVLWHGSAPGWLLLRWLHCAVMVYRLRTNWCVCVIASKSVTVSSSNVVTAEWGYVRARAQVLFTCNFQTG